jgi:putative membrane protein
MKLLSNLNQLNAKTRWAIAVCTVLAMSAGSISAQDQDKSQGGTGADSQTRIGRAGQSGQLSRTDEQFVRDAARGGMMEVHMGKMGVDKAQNAEVKQYAQKLVDDHSRANSELRQFASRKGITLPQERDGITSTTPGTTSTDPSAVGAPGTDSGTSTSSESKGAPGVDGGTVISKDSKAQSEMKKLHGLTGTEFDREYVRAAMKHHEKDVQQFEQASKKVEDQELKGWIEKTLPTLREHLQSAQRLQTTVGEAGAPGSDAGTSSDNSSSGTSTSSGTPSEVK